MTNPSTGSLRGSQKLIAHLAKNGDIPSADEIKKALGIAPSTEIKVANWLIRGIPPAYLDLAGEFQCPVGHVAEIVDRFVRLNDSTLNIKILINGIPFPDLATVTVRNSPEEI